MQRPIEFRFWCKGTSANANFNKCGFWSYPDFLLNKYFPNFNIFESEDFVAQQFTGMLDKGGKKIFEGDIVKAYVHVGYGDWDYRIGVVKYSCIDAQYEVCDADDVRTNNIGGHLICDGEEVVGNIFENPELLK